MPPMETDSCSSTSNRMIGRMEEKKFGSPVETTSVSTSGGGSGSSMGSHSKKSGLSRSEMDEAYRRLGHRLSLRVAGEDSTNKQPKCTTLKATPNGAFRPLETLSRKASLASTTTTGPCSLTTTCTTQSTSASSENDDDTSSQTSYDRTHKVAKMHLRDHGEHQHSTAGSSILKRITCLARDNFRTMVEASPPQKTKGKKRTSPNTTCESNNNNMVSPQRHALSKLALGGNSSEQLQKQSEAAAAASSSKGLLHAVLEGRDTCNETTTTSTETSSAQPRKCLTSPTEPVANDGFDNAEGNLIVHQNDVLRISCRTLNRKHKTTTTLKILGLLGQGTFAMVFKCLDMDTNQMVALKVVKNRPAYTRQAAVEIDVFMNLDKDSTTCQKDNNMVQLLSYCMHQNHLCLVFDLLGSNLYEVLKRRQFRGLPLSTVKSLMGQAMEGVRELCRKSIVHCDLKPENILLVNDESDKIKLIDFGSACFEGHTAHTYIQSRFYRSPEVLCGLPYDSAIDMWSLGCVAAELFLGLPILPGVHEHDQLIRINEMIGSLPDKMLEEGSKANKHFVKYFPKAPANSVTPTPPPPRTPSPGMSSASPPPPPRPAWRIKTLQEYIAGLTKEEIRKKGGLAKLQKQPTSRYFKRKKLSDIVMLHGQASHEDKEELGLFCHFLMGILDPDPWKRWTAFQACSHPFITGSKNHRRKFSGEGEEPKKEFDIYWVPPWDPAVCRRRLLHVQKTRERQQARRQKFGRDARQNQEQQHHVVSPNGTSRVTAMAETMTLNNPVKASSAPQGEVPTTTAISGSPPTSITASPGRPYPGVYPGIPHPGSGSLGPGALQRAGSHTGIMSGTPTNMVPPPAYFAAAAASSLSDLQYHHGAAIMNPSMMQMPSMHGGLGDYGMNQQVPYSSSGAQSFSGLAPDGMHHFPMEAELGFALQRPGVVPGSELSSTPVMLPQLQAAMSAAAFSPHQMHSIPMNGMPGQGRSGSFTNPPSSTGRGAARRRRHTFNSINGQATTAPQSPYMHGGYMTSPTTSIREDGADYSLGEENARSVDSGGTTSLLAQQLAEHSAAPQPAQDRPTDMVPQGPSSFPLAGGYGLSPAGLYGSNTTAPQQQMNLYYYVAADGTPVVMPPQHPKMVPAAQQMQMYGSHGSFQDGGMMAAAAAAAAQPMINGATSAPMHVNQGGIPPHLAQPSFEEMEYAAAQQQQQQGMPYWSGVVPPPPRPRPPYRGMSM